MDLIDVMQGLPTGFPTNICKYIDMEHWGFSNGHPLYTYGAGACMVVVVHHDNTSKGGLAHVAVHTRNQKVIHDKACAVIEKIFSCIGNKDNLQIWLGGGTGFQTDVNDNRVGFDFPEDLKVFLHSRKCKNFSIRDDRNRQLANNNPNVTLDSGQVVYNPFVGTVYLLSNTDLSAVQHDSGRQQQADVSGNWSNDQWT